MINRRAVTGAIAEPIGKAPAQRHEWDNRKRGALDDAERYTRFVMVMRRALLAAALVLVGVVIAFSLIPRQQGRVAMSIEKMGLVSGDLAMIKPKLRGTDSEGNPFVVTADQAVQNPKNLRQAALTNVEADVTLKQNQWLNVTAPHGLLDNNARTLQLSGAIAVFTDQGFEMHTDLAQIDLGKGIVVGPHHVTGQGPSGTFVADHFRVERISDPCKTDAKAQKKPHISKSHRRPGASAMVCPAPSPGAPPVKRAPLIRLFGNVHMQIYPGAMKKK